MPGGRVAIPGGLGVVGVVIYLLVTLLGGGGGGGGTGGFQLPGGASFDNGVQAPAPSGGTDVVSADEDPERDLKDFSVYVFNDVQGFWDTTFRSGGKRYERAKLRLYRTAVNTSGCGSASSAVGPFYCPGDARVYLDLSFYDQMQTQLGAKGDFAWAYVIAHEMGHHVQNLLGTQEAVSREQRADSSKANELSVRTELQADCYSGVWAHSEFKQGGLEAGDLDEAFGAAEAVGDDRLQKQQTGTVRPDTFTHGSSEQRRRWFDTGYESGEPAKCDTFGAGSL